MKAIIITFDGDIKDEKRLAEACMASIHTYASTANEVSVSIISDKELAEMLVNKVVIAKPINPELNVVRDICKKIVEAVGAIPLRTREIANREICRFLVRQNVQTISAPIAMIAKINCSAEYKEHREILQNYGLSQLPELIRDLNPTFKFY